VDTYIQLSDLVPTAVINMPVKTEEDAQTAYAVALMGDGILDPFGDGSRHDALNKAFEKLKPVGDPLGPVEYPYPATFDSREDINGLGGKFQYQGGVITVSSGDRIGLMLPEGKWKVQFEYEIVGGAKHQSILTFTAADAKQETWDNGMWQDLNHYQDFNITEKGKKILEWKFEGKGKVRIWNVIIWDVTKGKQYFYREFKNAQAFYNPKLFEDVNITLYDGSVHVLKAGTGYVDFFNADDEIIAIKPKPIEQEPAVYGDEFGRDAEPEPEPAPEFEEACIPESEPAPEPEAVFESEPEPAPATLRRAGTPLQGKKKGNLCQVTVENEITGIERGLSSAIGWGYELFPEKDVLTFWAPIGQIIQVKVKDVPGRWLCDDTKSGEVPILANGTELSTCHDFNGLKTYKFKANDSCEVEAR
jgi:hypothetical protein